MDQQESSRDARLAQLPRNAQACDSDCAFFAAVADLEDWGWCSDPRCVACRGLVRRGRECPRFACLPPGMGRGDGA